MLVRGVFERQRFLDLLRHFIVFEEDTDSGALHKIIAGYHQFHAVAARRCERDRRGDRGPKRRPARAAWSGTRRARARASRCSSTPGEIVRHPAMQNPTLVVLTDRNDLDDQLFGQFQRCHELLRQTPVQAESRRASARAAASGVAAAWSSRRSRSSCPTRRASRMPVLSRPAEHRRHRRRSAPQPVRPDRRAGPAHARCPAECLVHRLHRHADREDRRQHAGRLRRLHQHLRHPAGRRRQGDGADLLREPHRQAGAERRPSCRRSTRSSRRSPKARR